MRSQIWLAPAAELLDQITKALPVYRATLVKGCVIIFTKVYKQNLAMFPRLLQATHDYWLKLDRLEAAYQRGEVSIEEVDAKVAALIADLQEERRATIGFFRDRLVHLWQSQRELVLGLSLIGILTYTWLVVS